MKTPYNFAKDYYSSHEQCGPKWKENVAENIFADTLLVVDIQPEYENYIGFIPSFITYVNNNSKNFHNIIFLYNGSQTLGMISENEYKMWLIDNGLSEDIIDLIQFYDKGYAFFRHCIDSGVSVSTIVNFIKFMYDNNINDSRDMTRDMWAKYLRKYRKLDRNEIYNLLKESGEMIYIPDLMSFLSEFNNIELCGGGKNECLCEVEIALLALNKKYKVNNNFIY